MAVHPQVQALLERMSQAPMPELDSLTPEALRSMMDQPMAQGEPEPVAGVEERTIPGPAGELPVRIYRPEGPGPHRLLVFFHGGGWVVGTLDTHDGLARALCNAASAVVVSVAYRLAPEHPFPAAPEDCYAATRWAAEHAGEWHARADSLAVAGDSAGAALAAVVCQMSADRQGPELACQLLLYPVADHDFDTPSYRDNGEGYFLTRSMMEWFWSQYLGGDASLAEAAYCAPLRRHSLAGLPPAMVVTAEYDPLRDEGDRYAQALAAAGVAVEHRCREGMIHGFASFLDLVDAARETVAELAEFYRRQTG